MDLGWYGDLDIAAGTSFLAARAGIDRDAYGWRGWVQERVEDVQDGVTDYLTEASPPIPWRAAVTDAHAARFLLITAGNVDDERRAASFLQSAASDRVAVWNVVGADHTGGDATRPDEWRQRVVAFLDQSLD